MSVLFSAEGNARQVYDLPMDRITVNPDQPRKTFDDYALLTLASSIRQHGLLQPITVRPRDNGYEIVMGERRYRACQLLGFTRIDAFILPVGEGDAGPDRKPAAGRPALSGGGVGVQEPDPSGHDPGAAGPAAGKKPILRRQQAAAAEAG